MSDRLLRLFLPSCLPHCCLWSRLSQSSLHEKMLPEIATQTAAGGKKCTIVAASTAWAQLRTCQPSTVRSNSGKTMEQREPKWLFVNPGERGSVRAWLRFGSPAGSPSGNLVRLCISTDDLSVELSTMKFKPDSEKGLQKSASVAARRCDLAWPVPGRPRWHRAEDPPERFCRRTPGRARRGTPERSIRASLRPRPTA